MGQELNGSLGSWVTLSDPFPALQSSTTVLTVRRHQGLQGHVPIFTTGQVNIQD